MQIEEIGNHFSIMIIDLHSYFTGVIEAAVTSTWWRHQMETFSALLTICAGNSPVPGEFPAQRPVTRSFDVFFDLRLNKRLSKQWWGWWFETLLCPLWRHHNEIWLWYETREQYFNNSGKLWIEQIGLVIPTAGMICGSYSPVILAAGCEIQIVHFFPTIVVLPEWLNVMSE